MTCAEAIAGSILIIWHSRTGASEAMALAAAEGAGEVALLLHAAEVREEHMLAASAYLFVFPENLGSMSGEMKEMFDRNYYALLGKIEGRAFASIIAAGSDGEGAGWQLERIVTGWRLRRVAEPYIACFHAQSPEEIWAAKALSERQRQDCHDIGSALAEGISLGIF